MEELCLTEHDFIQTTDGHNLPYAATCDLLNVRIRDEEIEDQPPDLRIEDLKEEQISSHGKVGNVGDRWEGSGFRLDAFLPRSQNDENCTEGEARSSSTETNDNIILESSSRSRMNGTVDHDLGEPRYHVFFSHAREDRNWVVDVLKKLESHEYGFTCCFADRDFELGRSVFDNITRSIQASAKTVIVLSPEFLSSDWCEYEMRMTLEADLISRKRILIPVMLRPCRVPDFIGRLTYIEVENEHFWERFISALKQTDDCKVDVSQSGNYIPRSEASSLQLPFHHNLDKLAKISLRENCDCCSDTSYDIVPNELSGSMSAEDFQNILEILNGQQFVKRHAFFAWPSTGIPWLVTLVVCICLFGFIMAPINVPLSVRTSDLLVFGLPGVGLIIICCAVSFIHLKCGHKWANNFTRAIMRANEISLPCNMMVGSKTYGSTGCQCNKLTVQFYFYDWRLCLAHFREHLRSSEDGIRISDYPDVNAAAVPPITTDEASVDLITLALVANIPEYLELFDKKKLQSPNEERHVRRCECLCQFAERLNQQNKVQVSGVKSRRQHMNDEQSSNLEIPINV